jgi:uncharacterized membrane protein
MAYSPEIEKELDDAAADLATARGWTSEYARGIVEQVVSSFAHGTAEIRRWCICDGPVHRYTPEWCAKPRFADIDGKLLPTC